MGISGKLHLKIHEKCQTYKQCGCVFSFATWHKFLLLWNDSHLVGFKVNIYACNKTSFFSKLTSLKYNSISNDQGNFAVGNIGLFSHKNFFFFQSYSCKSYCCTMKVIWIKAAWAYRYLYDFFHRLVPVWRRWSCFLSFPSWVVLCVVFRRMVPIFRGQVKLFCRGTTTTYFLWTPWKQGRKCFLNFQEIEPLQTKQDDLI